MSNLSWLNPIPHATAVYASCSALLPPHATLASRRPATALPGPDLHRLIAPALAGAFLLNHLVRTQLEFAANCESKRPSSLKIDDQFKFAWLLYWKIGGVCGFFNF